jgi:transposase
MKPLPKHSAKSENLPIVHPHAAGIDIGAQFHVVAVGADRDVQPVRSFRSFTADLHSLAKWLKEVGVTSVAMESTGIYWLPVFEILEASGFEVFLVNARDAKNVPGRKTDVSDAQWLQRLHQYGLLRASFRPQHDIATLRAYLRQRERLLEYAAAHIQHMQKALVQMNLQLQHVVSDVTGATGMTIIRAIIAGERRPEVLAQYRDVRCKASQQTIHDALIGNYRPEHVFALTQAVALYDFYQTAVAQCDDQIEAVLKQLAVSSVTAADLPRMRCKTKQSNGFTFDVRQSLFAMLGVDLTQIHGMGPYLALKLIAECGSDMSRWPSAKYFTSWLSLAPGNKISGGKILSSKTRRSSSEVSCQ